MGDISGSYLENYEHCCPTECVAVYSVKPVPQNVSQGSDASNFRAENINLPGETGVGYGESRRRVRRYGKATNHECVWRWVGSGKAGDRFIVETIEALRIRKDRKR